MTSDVDVHQDPTGDPLTGAAAVATALAATSEEKALLADLSARQRRRRLRVLVAGEANRGKSTLVNALLGRDVLPTAIRPLTSVATRVTAADGNGERALVVGQDGRTTSVPLDDLPDYVTETGNPQNRRRVVSVSVHVHAALIDDFTVDLLDAPGTGSVFGHNDEDAEKALGEMDAAILVLTGDPVMTRAERDLLARVDGRSVMTFVVLNKVDRLTPPELADALAFTAQTGQDAVGHRLQVWPLSARHRDQGFDRFASALQDYLSRAAASDLRESTRRHTQRALESMIDLRRVRVAAVSLAMDGRRQPVVELAQRLAALDAGRARVDDVLRGAMARLRQHLDTAATHAVPDIRRRVQAEVDHAWAGAAGQQDPQEALLDLRRVADQLIRDRVEQWRQRQSERLTGSLQELAHGVEEDLHGQALAAQAAVRSVLDVELMPPPQPEPLHADLAFRYDFSRPVGWQAPMEDTLTAWASRTRSRAAQVERAQRRLADEVASMVDRQVGRARSDLQARLVDAHRHFRRQVQTYLDETVSRFGAAVTSASVRQDSTRAADHDEVQRLTGEVDRLLQALSLLALPS